MTYLMANVHISYIRCHFLGANVHISYICGMKKPLLPVPLARDRGFTIHPDNPFRDEILKFYNNEKEAVRTYQATVNLTVIETKQYVPAGWVKLYQRMDLLSLSPAACKAFIYIAIKMNFDTQKIHLNQAEMGMDRRVAGKALLELLSEGIIKQEKRGWFWVNLTMVVMGKISKD